jgi:hypothetical protein
MTFKTADVRLDFWRKTSKVRSGSHGRSVVPRELTDIDDPQGEKFLNAKVFGIAEHVRLSSTVIRRKVASE